MSYSRLIEVFKSGGRQIFDSYLSVIFVLLMPVRLLAASVAFFDGDARAHL